MTVAKSQPTFVHVPALAGEGLAQCSFAALGAVFCGTSLYRLPIAHFEAVRRVDRAVRALSAEEAAELVAGLIRRRAGREGYGKVLGKALAIGGPLFDLPAVRAAVDEALAADAARPAPPPAGPIAPRPQR